MLDPPTAGSGARVTSTDYHTARRAVRTSSLVTLILLSKKKKIHDFNKVRNCAIYHRVSKSQEYKYEQPITLSGWDSRALAHSFVRITSLESRLVFLLVQKSPLHVENYSLMLLYMALKETRLCCGTTVPGLKNRLSPFLLF